MNRAKNLYQDNLNVRVRPVVFLNMFWLGLLLAFAITPLLSRMEIYVVKLGVLLMWAVTTILLPRKKGIYFPKKLIGWWIVYVVWIFAMCIIGHSNVSLNFFIVRLPFYAIPFIMVTVVRSYNIKELHLLWILFLGIFLTNLVHNYYIGLTTPELFDQLNAMTDDSGMKTNAGGTALVALCLFICPIMWIISQNVENTSLKLQTLTCLVLATIYMTILNVRATAFFFWLLMAFMFLLYRWGQGRQFSYRKYVTIILLGVVILVIFATTIMDTLLELFSESKQMYERLEQIMEVMQGTSIDDTNNGSLGVRIMLSITSIKTFLASPSNFFFGVGEDSHGQEIYDLVKYGVGCHSEFFDLAARYGLVGIFIVTNFLIHLFKYIRRFCFTSKTSGMLTILIIGYILYNFFNNTFDVSTFNLLLLFLPLSLILVNTVNYKQMLYEQRKYS